uniref:AlNc14C265G9886 protein n=1 Tax=Albugo laibachii Nc14 TaxID=890382 RepID=F0WU62_9STRA|nr:AlNc14C265G9886 [Albugo laibachii Nc14]|eukprot:CCA24940.1 AlNc14C265G9886 [Albugo laibachii Nc14]
MTIGSESATGQMHRVLAAFLRVNISLTSRGRQIYYDLVWVCMSSSCSDRLLSISLSFLSSGIACVFKSVTYSESQARRINSFMSFLKSSPLGLLDGISSCVFDGVLKGWPQYEWFISTGVEYDRKSVLILIVHFNSDSDW